MSYLDRAIRQAWSVPVFVTEVPREHRGLAWWHRFEARAHVGDTWFGFTRDGAERRCRQHLVDVYLGHAR